MIHQGKWIEFDDYALGLTVRTLYLWRLPESGDFYSLDPYLFSNPPDLKFVVPAPDTKSPPESEP